MAGNLLPAEGPGAPWMARGLRLFLWPVARNLTLCFLRVLRGERFGSSWSIYDEKGCKSPISDN